LPESCGTNRRGLEDVLVRAALARCRRAGGKLAQAIVPTQDAGRAAPLVRQGFARVTRLGYLEHNLRDLPPETQQPEAVRFESFSPANEAQFRQALQRSYAGTLDCPELNGVRTIDEVLGGYRGKGPFRPERWWLVVADGQPAGVVLLTDLPEGPAWDLSYVGIVPEQRRRGLGRCATGRVLHAAHSAGVAAVLLAVDMRNEPARRLYRSLGFVETAERDVYLNFLTDPPNAAGTLERT
jgi:ribosomal protein S18 acetylase RimI-like enzyme